MGFGFLIGRSCGRLCSRWRWFVDGNIETVEESVAEVLGGQSAEWCFFDDCSGGRGHVVAVVLAGLEEGGGGWPVCLVEESRVEFGGERLPRLLLGRLRCG